MNVVRSHIDSRLFCKPRTTEGEEIVLSLPELGLFWLEGTSELVRDDAGTDKKMIMELAGCLQQSMWCKAAEHCKGRGCSMMRKEPGCQAVSRVLK